MRSNRHFVSGGKTLIGLGIIIIVASVIVAYSNFFSLPWDPVFVINVGVLCFIGFSLIGSALIWLDTSWVTPRPRDMAPDTPDRDHIARVVISSISEKEYLVYGAPGETVHDVIANDWPYDHEHKKSEWYVVDSDDNDVSERSYSEVEGTLKVVFE